MSLLGLGLAASLLLVFAIQLPPIVAFVRAVRRAAKEPLPCGFPPRQARLAATEGSSGGVRIARKSARIFDPRTPAGNAVTTALLDAPEDDNGHFPEVPSAVCVLCLRGQDPFLKDCLRGLLLQEYPDYDVLIVVDSQSDPALFTVNDILGELPPEIRKARNVFIEVVDKIYPYGALKGSALIHAARVIRSKPYAFVALLDADTIPHPTWLAELVAPFSDPSVGVTSGNRWYMPKEPTWGSLIRYVWNAGAVVQMFWNRFTWGGSVALRKELFCDRELSARWRRSLSTDTVIYQVAKHHGWQTRFVPTILMVNRESCSLRRLFPWITRQILVGKLYHPGWPWVLGHGLGTTAALAAGIVFCLVAMARGAWTDCGIVLTALLAYWGGNVGVLRFMENSVQAVLRRRGQEAAWKTPWVELKLVLSMPVTQFFNAAAILATFFVKKVTWRGITYRLEGNRVRMEEYRPFTPSASQKLSVLQSL